MIYIFLLCLCVHLVSANPLSKLLLQTRPNCNQNGYSSYNVQANNQPYAPPFMTQNPMTSSNNQLFGPENELPIQIKLDDPNQSYLHKILGNPVLQNILNRNNNFNQNSKDLTSQPNLGQTPNIVNNYYIIPPECIQGKDDGIEIVKKIIEDQAILCQKDEISNQKHCENERNNLQRSHNRPNEEKRRPKGNRRPHSQGNGSVRNQNNNNTQKRKRKNGHQNQNTGNQRSNSKNTNTNVNNKNRESVKIKDEGSLPHKLNGTEESQPRKNGNKKRKRPRNKSKNEELNNVQQVSNETISSKNYSIQNEKEIEPHLRERSKYTNISRNNKDEDVIKDIHKKFPGIPKDVIRRLLAYLRRHLRISCPSTQSSDAKINPNQSHNTNVDNKKRRNNQRNQNKRRKPKNNTDLVEVTESSPSITTDNLINSTQSATLKTTSNNQVDEITKYTNEQELTTQPEIKTEVVDTTTTSITDLHAPKLGEEDKILDLENDVDDYFPDFRFDKMYMSEDEYIRSLRANRFYYTTDRNYNSENYNKNEESSEIYYEPYEPSNIKKVNNFESHEIEDSLKRPDTVFLDDNYDSVEDIKFQTPPILEYPDFETKPVIKYFDVDGPIYVDNLNDKSSTYSDAKSVNTSLKKKPKSDNIETVFARSKVATYGKPKELEDDTLKNKENSKLDNTVLVYAKSLTDS